MNTAVATALQSPPCWRCPHRIFLFPLWYSHQARRALVCNRRRRAGTLTALAYRMPSVGFENLYVRSQLRHHRHRRQPPIPPTLLLSYGTQTTQPSGQLRVTSRTPQARRTAAVTLIRGPHLCSYDCASRPSPTTAPDFRVRRQSSRQLGLPRPESLISGGGYLLAAAPAAR